MRHLYLQDTGKLACGLPSERRSCTVDMVHVDCDRCQLAASAWRREATRALRSAIRSLIPEGNSYIDQPFTAKPSDLIGALLAAMSGKARSA